jgi:hypothetical protein
MAFRSAGPFAKPSNWYSVSPISAARQDRLTNPSAICAFFFNGLNPGLVSPMEGSASRFPASGLLE